MHAPQFSFDGRNSGELLHEEVVADFDDRLREEADVGVVGAIAEKGGEILHQLGGSLARGVRAGERVAREMSALRDVMGLPTAVSDAGVVAEAIDREVFGILARLEATRVDLSGSAGIRGGVVKAGGRAFELSEHGAVQMTKRKISMGALKGFLEQPPFDYVHEGIPKQGYFNPATNTFAETVEGRITTVMQGSGVPRYLRNLGWKP